MTPDHPITRLSRLAPGTGVCIAFVASVLLFVACGDGVRKPDESGAGASQSGLVETTPAVNDSPAPPPSPSATPTAAAPARPLTKLPSRPGPDRPQARPPTKVEAPVSRDKPGQTTQADPYPLIHSLPDRDLEELAVRLRGVDRDASPAGSSPQLREGAQEQFWITDLDDGAAHRITATLRIISDNAYWFVDNAVSVDEKGLERAASRFEDEVHPAVTGTFGDIRSPGIDGDPRLVILHSRLRGAAGYFGAKDAYSTRVHRYSNSREIIYIDAFELHPGTDLYMGVIAHELQHAVHFNHDEGEESWVNEGLSEVATAAAGYELQSPEHFLMRPHVQLNYWPDAPDGTIPHYGASALFFSYLAQRVGGAQKLAGLVAEPLDGVAGVETFANRNGLTFEDLFADWIIANYLDAADRRYGYYDQRVRVGPLRSLRSSSGRREFLPQFSARYYKVDSGGARGILSFQGDTEVKQIGGECVDGPQCWWSGRGDSIDTTLTRGFDLTGLEGATLEFMVWYEIEEGWDYGYVEASDDGGRTWRILEGEHTTTYDPSGNAYGPGYTGSSGGWLRESIDLTPFAGGPVLLRFEYVTDDAVYLDGLMIDGVSVSEMGFYGDAIGWTANGFSLAGETLPQEFIVQIISVASDGSFTVSRLDLDDTNLGQTKLTGTDAETVVVVVSPITPGTRHSAGYTLEFASSE